MNRLNGKLKKQDGFTLIEMLIVVAIISILVAVSIPLVGMATERAAHATDAANERAAKAELLLCYLTGEKVEDKDGNMVEVGETDTTEMANRFYYDAPNGRLTQKYDDITKYGKHRCDDQCYVDHETSGIIICMIDKDKTVKMNWVSQDLINDGTTTGVGYAIKLCTSVPDIHGIHTD